MKKQQIAEIEQRLLLREILEIKKSTQQSEKRIVESIARSKIKLDFLAKYSCFNEVLTKRPCKGINYGSIIQKCLTFYHFLFYLVKFSTQGITEISMYLLPYVWKGALITCSFPERAIPSSPCIDVRLSVENITIRIIFGKNYALCTKSYQIKEKPNHVCKELQTKY